MKQLSIPVFLTCCGIYARIFCPHSISRLHEFSLKLLDFVHENLPTACDRTFTFSKIMIISKIVLEQNKH